MKTLGVLILAFVSGAVGQDVPKWTVTHFDAATFTIAASDSWDWKCPAGTKMYVPADVSFVKTWPESPSEREKRKRETKPVCIREPQRAPKAEDIMPAKDKMTTGNPECLPTGVTFKHFRHHSEPDPLTVSEPEHKP